MQEKPNNISSFVGLQQAWLSQGYKRYTFAPRKCHYSQLEHFNNMLYRLLTALIVFHAIFAIQGDFILKICTKSNLGGECSQLDGKSGDCRGNTPEPLSSATLSPAGSIMVYSDVNCDPKSEIDGFDLSSDTFNFPQPLKAKSVMFL
jgi:hypothetical protein